MPWLFASAVTAPTTNPLEKSDVSDAARDDHPDDAHRIACYDGAVLQAPNDPLSSGREAQPLSVPHRSNTGHDVGHDREHTPHQHRASVMRASTDLRRGIRRVSRSVLRAPAV